MRLPIPACLLFLLADTALSAQSIPSAEYAARRQALAASIDSGVVLGFGAPDPTGPHGFEQLPGFRYLTGFLEPNAAFVLVKRGGRVTGTLYTTSRDPRRALYDGFPADSATLTRETALAVRSLPALEPAVDSLLGLGLPLYHLRDFASADAAVQDSLTRGARFIAGLAGRHKQLEVRDAHPIVDSLRATKSPAELALLRKAIDITVASLTNTMRSARPGMYEYELEAMVESGFRRAGAEGPSFGSIVGAGLNSTQYHYVRNDRRTTAGDVVLMDVGASYRGYAADVTRTFPVSGKFTPEQRSVYQLVRDAQAAAERVVKPGVSFETWRDTARVVLAQGLARLGLIESPDATFDPPWSGQCGVNPVSCTQAFLFMAHGLGHGIGLEVHDLPRPYRGSGKFEVSHVFTIEPGVYVSTRLLEILPDTPKNRKMIAKVRKAVERYQNIGVRIEDDYVVTKDGFEWLSRAPREVAEIEALRLVSSVP